MSQFGPGQEMTQTPSSTAASLAIAVGLFALSAMAGLAVIEARANLNIPVSLAGEPVPPASQPPLPAHRVLVVVVDGLGGDVARTLPTFH